MRILHINTENTWRGGEKQLMYLVEGLKRCCHSSTIICQPESILAKEAGSRGFDVIPMRMRGEIDPIAVYRIYKFIKKSSPDIIHLHTSHAHLLGGLAAICAGRKEIIVSRRVDFPPGSGVLNRLKYQHIPRFYIPVSNAIKEILIKKGIDPSKIKVIRSGIEVKNSHNKYNVLSLKRSLGLDNEVKVIGCVGHMAGHKGQRFLIEAFPDILQHYENVRLILVGDGELRVELEKRALELGIKDKIVFTGFVKGALSFYHIFDIFAHPSVLEGLGTSILDALSYGVPVISTRVGGITEIIEDGVNGLLVPPGDSRALADGIIHLLSDDTLVKKLREKGRETVSRRFNIDDTVERTIQVYQLVAATPRKGL